MVWEWVVYIFLPPKAVEVRITPIAIYDVVYFTHDPERCVVEGRPGWEIKRREPLSHAKWSGKSEERLIFEGKAKVSEVERLEALLTHAGTFLRFDASHPIPANLQEAYFVPRTFRFELLPGQFEGNEQMTRYRLELVRSGDVPS